MLYGVVVNFGEFFFSFFFKIFFLNIFFLKKGIWGGRKFLFQDIFAKWQKKLPHQKSLLLSKGLLFRGRGYEFNT
jgi:hypothetical protein